MGHNRLDENHVRYLTLRGESGGRRCAALGMSLGAPSGDLRYVRARASLCDGRVVT